MTAQGRDRRKLDELNKLASRLLADGMFADAMKACLRSLRAQETPAAKAMFVRLLKTGTAYDSPFMRQYLVRALAEPWCRTGQLVPASVASIRSGGETSRCIERAVSSWPTPLSMDALFGTGGLIACGNDDLLIAVLENTPAASLELEHFLMLARRALLLGAAVSQPTGSAEPSILRFCCALARQCHINEYVYDTSAEEDEAVSMLRDAITDCIAESKPVPVVSLAVLACYAPLSSLPRCERLAQAMTLPPLAGLFSQQVKEPLQELGYRATLQRLTEIDDETSRRVGEQYEQHPYPRWVRSPPVDGAGSFTAFLQSELGLRFARRHDKVEVLIAGCGTGQQSLQTARRFPDAKILAVDLSAASLAYAIRKTKELRIANVDYAQADLSKLGSIGRTFDFIQCVGVLHHLEDPLAGWQVLRSLLRPGGVMHIGLYSAIARRDIAAAQQLVAMQGYASTTEGIRRFRADLQLLDRWRPFRWLTMLEDFYDTSGCRDLLFHVKEHRFTLQQMKQMLRTLELDFLKFNVDEAVQQSYSQRFPSELATADLNAWTQFEDEHPGTFLGMYNFYVQRRT